MSEEQANCFRVLSCPSLSLFHADTLSNGRWVVFMWLQAEFGSLASALFLQHSGTVKGSHELTAALYLFPTQHAKNKPFTP